MSEVSGMSEMTMSGMGGMGMCLVGLVCPVSPPLYTFLLRVLRELSGMSRMSGITQFMFHFRTNNRGLSVARALHKACQLLTLDFRLAAYRNAGERSLEIRRQAYGGGAGEAISKFSTGRITP